MVVQAPPQIVFGPKGSRLRFIDIVAIMPKGLAGFAELQHMARLSIEEASLDRGGAAEPP
jgi:hypothetical protein